ncbi:hypothetical protein PRUPE_4G276700 [Prunus persica]|uniref:Uncharacterized protein n=1 Tax=Prunus persica TaxID=3760 RepID=A0A251PV67_PRUPE|nr:hypothetical protein PRUPE_4G276700 [Prunus persica]
MKVILFKLPNEVLSMGGHKWCPLENSNSKRSYESDMNTFSVLSYQIQFFILYHVNHPYPHETLTDSLRLFVVI